MSRPTSHPATTDVEYHKLESGLKSETPGASRCDSFTAGLWDCVKFLPYTVVYGGFRYGLKKLQTFLEKHSKVDRGLVVVCAAASGVVAISGEAAFGALFLPKPYVIPGIPGMIILFIESLIANIALLLGFKLSDNIKLTLRARDRIGKMNGLPRLAIELFWLYMLVNYLAESIAQGELTAAAGVDALNYDWMLPSILSILEKVFFALGWAGFTLSRSAAIARILYLLLFPANLDNIHQLEDSQGIRYDDKPISITDKMQELFGRKTMLPRDEQIVDMLGNVVTGGLLVADFFVVFKMYSWKLLKGVQRIINVCSGDASCKNVSLLASRTANGLSVLNFVFFYFPLQNALLHSYRYYNSSVDFLQRKNMSRFGARFCVGLSGFAMVTVGRGSIGGLLTPGARGPANVSATTALMMFVNTTPMIKESAKYLSKKVSETVAPVRNIQDTHQMPHVSQFNQLFSRISECSTCCFFGSDEVRTLVINNSSPGFNAIYSV